MRRPNARNRPGNCSRGTGICARESHASQIHPAYIRLPWRPAYGGGSSAKPNRQGCEMEAEPATIVKAPVPVPVIKGSFASPEAVAHILVQKFVMGVPIYRQEQQLAPRETRTAAERLAFAEGESADQSAKGYCCRGRRCATGQSDVLWTGWSRFTTRFTRGCWRSMSSTGMKPRFKSCTKRAGRLKPRVTSGCTAPAGDAKFAIVLCEYQTGRGSEYPIAFLAGFNGFLHTDGWPGGLASPNFPRQRRGARRTENWRAS